MDKACSTNGERRTVFWIVVGKLEGKGPLGRPRCGLVNNIKIYLTDVG
jgi:hypothetical protein